jgi:hypothetical protein
MTDYLWTKRRFNDGSGYGSESTSLGRRAPSSYRGLEMSEYRDWAALQFLSPVPSHIRTVGQLTNYGSGSLRLDVRRLDDRPPFLDLGLVKRAEGLGCL